MKASPFARRFTLALTFFVAPSAVMANQCGDLSPLLKQLGEQYYELDELSKSQSKAYEVEPNTIIDAVRSVSYKAGEGTRTRCFGVSELRAETREFALEPIDTPRVNSFNEVVINAFEYEAKTKTARRESVFIPLARQYITLKGDNSFVVNSRHKHSILGNPRRTHLREIATEAFSSQQGIDIVQSIYVNGHLVEWFTWNLRK